METPARSFNKQEETKSLEGIGILLVEDNPLNVMVAKAYNIEGQSISKREDLKNALSTMLNHKGSYLLEVMVGKSPLARMLTVDPPTV